MTIKIDYDGIPRSYRDYLDLMLKEDEYVSTRLARSKPVGDTMSESDSKLRFEGVVGTSASPLTAFILAREQEQDAQYSPHPH